MIKEVLPYNALDQKREEVMLAYTDHLMINKTNKDSSKNTFKKHIWWKYKFSYQLWNCKMYVNSIIKLF